MGTDMKKGINKNFILLLLGQTISKLGSGMTSFAVVIWAYSSTGLVFSSSLLAACGTIPYLIVSLFGGAAADSMNKKKIMLICDTVAAAGSFMILILSSLDLLTVWILCVVNAVNGFMNAFQGPASQVAVTLLVDKEHYAKIGGIQSAAGAVVGILNPILAAAILSLGGLTSILLIDLFTFLFAFFTLLFFIRIPDCVQNEEKTGIAEIFKSANEGIRFIKKQKSIFYLLLVYSVLEFMGAISFDSMYSPLLLARTGGSETVVGVVSAFAAAGSLLASFMLSVTSFPRDKMPLMFTGSIMCLTGIALFGIGRSTAWWCAVVLLGCFGAPVYQTCQTVILRETVPVSMQGRIFSLQGMVTQSLAPLGYLSGAVLADRVFEPLMKNDGCFRELFGKVVGLGSGAGMGLMFVLAGGSGIVIIMLLRNKIVELFK